MDIAAFIFIALMISAEAVKGYSSRKRRCDCGSKERLRAHYYTEDFGGPKRTFHCPAHRPEESTDERLKEATAKADYFERKVDADRRGLLMLASIWLTVKLAVWYYGER